MKLEMATFTVIDVKLADQTRLQGGELEIDASELKALLMAGGEFADVAIDVARPGDSTRVVHVIDVVEPRVRFSQAESDFPGMLSAPSGAGIGKTNRLDGVVITEVAEPIPGEPTYWREAIFDMSGDAAQLSPFSSKINIVLTFKPRPQHSTDSNGSSAENVFEGTAAAVEFNKAVRVAGLRAAVYLAGAAREQKADRVDEYELSQGAEALPTVVYMYQTGMPYVYGEIASGGGGGGSSAQLPTLIHPNEILDGALVNSFSGPASTREVTYMLQNHPVVQDLYAHDGKDLRFGGVVMYAFGDSTITKERITSYAASLASLLGADGAVLNYLGGGHPAVDFMLTCQKLEQHGVKTALISPEMAGNPEDSGFVHFVREADAIVSTGNYEQVIDLPRVSKVLGGSTILESGAKSQGPISVTLRHILSSTDQFGSAMLGGRQR